MNRAAPLLELTGMGKRYPGGYAVDGVDVSIFAGDIIGLVGKNGAGKSTLIKMLGGVVAPDEGQIAIDGVDVSIHSANRATKLGLTLVHQELANAPDLSVAENLVLGLGYPKRLGLFIDRSRLRRQAREVLDAVGVDVDPSARLGSLSVAQQRMVTIARGLGTRMRVLVLDEPSASLTDKEILHLHRVVRSLAADGVAVIYVSHRLDEIRSLTDRIVVMRDGRKIADQRTSETTPRELVALIAGKDDVASLPSRRAGADSAVTTGEPVLVADRVSSAFIDSASFALARGEVLGIGGLVGAGRTELVRAIFGADRMTGGTVTVAGKVARISSPADALAAGIALLPEDRQSQGALLSFSIRKNVTLASLRNSRFLRPFAIPSRAKELSITLAQMLRLDIAARSTEQTVRSLSGGNQQKVVFAKWLARGAEVFILDEPTHGVDVGAKAEFYRLARELAEQSKGVIFISSEFAELVTVCDRVLVMVEGRIVDELVGDEITEAAILDSCYATARAAGEHEASPIAMPTA